MSGERLEQVENKSEVPRLRVYLLQGYQLEWAGGSTEQEAAWHRRTSARALFVLLVCAPNRQASRGHLASILWPESDEEKARESLRSALKCLREVLRSGQSEDLLEARGDLLTLKGQEELWIDIDAISDLARQARNISAPHEALPLWEQARALLCRELLSEERTSEWSQYHWIKARRQELRASRRAMVRALSDFSIQSGQQGQAEELLHQHVIRFPTDQDALYRLLKLLIQAESFEEAWMYYERCRIALADLGKEPAEHVKALAQACRSRPQKMLAVWKSEQRQQRERDTTNLAEMVKGRVIQDTRQQIVGLTSEEVAALPDLLGLREDLMDETRRNLLRKLIALVGMSINTPKGFVDAASWVISTNQVISKKGENDLDLDLVDSYVETLRVLLAKGEAQYVMHASQNLYSKLLQEYPSSKDVRLAETQIRLGMLVGASQEYALPWYQRATAVMQTYNHIEAHIIYKFSENSSLRHEYVRLLAKRGRQQRVLWQFDACKKACEDGLSFLKELDDYS
ncbi:MAG TPA: BTAD domain-containing putative transcriptional regulator, partial [Ktedonobacteraceae bacterium]